LMLIFQVPNGIGVILGAMQLVLYAYYSRKWKNSEPSAPLLAWWKPTWSISWLIRYRDSEKRGVTVFSSRRFEPTWSIRCFVMFTVLDVAGFLSRCFSSRICSESCASNSFTCWY
jgi:hypothetical protein